MNNKGFTLVELLGVIIILIVIALLVFPAVSTIIGKSSDTTEKVQINNIFDAAYNLTLKNLSYLPNNDEVKCVTLAELKEDGLIDFNIINPKTKNRYPDNLVIRITNVGSGYKSGNKYSKVYGNYLYEFTKNIDSYYNDNSVNISFSGIQKNNIYGDYIVILDLNSTFNIIPNVSEGTKVVKYFTSNNELVESIDTSKSNTYKAYYTAIDNNCNASSEIVTVIVSDNTAPKIEIDSNITIGTSTNTLNLNDGVTCTDNSEYCDISIDDSELKYGVKGKYIIYYTATDPSGNSSTAKRVVNIK